MSTENTTRYGAPIAFWMGVDAASHGQPWDSCTFTDLSLITAWLEGWTEATELMMQEEEEDGTSL